MPVETLVNGTNEAIDWHAINWPKAYRMLKNLRSRIFRAAKEGDLKKVRSLQKLMLRSYANTVTSVRKVTQVNSGKHTPGVDQITVKTAKGRGRLTDGLLSRSLWHAKPARRIYILKDNGKQRPLGIPIVRERCLQTITANALEPEWEARFEASSYGFRPGRSCHDAIERIFAVARSGSLRKWVIDADIQGAFDNIDHDFLLQAIGNFPAKNYIKQWLKAGYMEGDIFYKTEQGTPQGACCSPLLANIALHGMEKMIGLRYASNGILKGDRRMVRYADDFAIFCRTKDDAEQMLPVLREWLSIRGLKLSEEKTRIVHLEQGFDFLGFNIRSYPVANKRKKTVTLIKPSKKAEQKIRDKLKAEWQTQKTANIEGLVKAINPIIRGWANYHRTGVAKKIFHSLDHWMFLKQCRHIIRMHNKKSWAWRRKKYFGRFSLERSDRWVFGSKKTGRYMLKFNWFKIERHTMVIDRSSPDDPSLKEYWKSREKVKMRDLTLGKQKIAKWQNYLCPVCKTSLFNDEELHLHHTQPKLKGGKNTYQNLRLVHEGCHYQLHSSSYNAIAVKNKILCSDTLFA
ncbi:RNA-directed DNA polymerase [Mucilaginibacter pineti]|uniref:RNA-directed DNA polymerase n=1 Tax=Mucilaginibacter pineti TaxID=1391627 RepID=A0A1G7P0F8_9SPHI|nr:group II intron reverse transcriptase/maturase [Mucilaginibacter pineti]SDF79786.1 RNA-directed DNA polymerase [Mucilaginibacter pineti]